MQGVKTLTPYSDNKKAPCHIGKELRDWYIKVLNIRHYNILKIKGAAAMQRLIYILNNTIIPQVYSCMSRVSFLSLFAV